MKIRFEKEFESIEIVTNDESPNLLIQYLKFMLEWAGMNTIDIDSCLLFDGELEEIKTAECYLCDYRKICQGEIPVLKDDAEEFLQGKDIWNHPTITSRDDKESFSVADLLVEFHNSKMEEI